MTHPLVLCRYMLMAVVITTASALAQVGDSEPWQESEVNLPTQWRIDRLVEFPLDGSGSMRHAIEPSTISIDGDGVVRYVFAARSSSGALNAFYEGIRCQTGEVKVYARWDVDARQWRISDRAPWQTLEFRGPTRRAMQMARGGICDNKVANQSAAHILNTLRNGRAEPSR